MSERKAFQFLKVIQKIKTKVFILCAFLLMSLLFLNQGMNNPAQGKANQAMALPLRETLSTLNALMSFKHNGESENMVLKFQYSNVHEQHQVKVKINGVVVAFLPVCKKRWSNEHAVHLPMRYLIKGENILEFKTDEKTDQSHRWSIKDVYVTYENSLIEDEEVLEKAKQLLKIYKAYPGFLNQADLLIQSLLVKFRQSNTLVDEQLFQLKEKIQQEKEKMKIDLVLKAKIAKSRGQTQLFQNAMDQIKAEFPNPYEHYKIFRRESLYD